MVFLYKCQDLNNVIVINIEEPLVVVDLQQLLIVHAGPLLVARTQCHDIIGRSWAIVVVLNRVRIHASLVR